MLILGFSVFWGTEMYSYGQPLNPVAELGALVKFPNMPNEQMNTGLTRLPSSLTPIRTTAQWQSSGSAWLDSKIGDAVINVRVEDPTADLRFQIYEDGKLQFHEELKGEQNYQYLYEVSPEKHYEFRVVGSDNQIVQVFLQSLMPFKIIE
jgi:hypothetical protein